MNCRIKYTKLKDGEIESGELISIKGTVYFVRIDFMQGCWKIFNVKRRNVIKEGYSQNKNVLRRMVRRELQKLGVKFEKEFTEKGYAKTRSG